MTARDIIALWVARMIMSSLYFVDEVPFHDVYIYATILAKDGSRMSKSKGNGVDPMELRRSTRRRHALQPPHAHHQQPGRQVRRQHRQEDAPAHRQPAHRAGARLRDQDLEREPLRPDEPRGATCRAPRLRDARGRVDAVAPCPCRRAQPPSSLETYAFGDYAREIQSFFWAMSATGTIELCKGRLLDGTPEERLQVQRNSSLS